MTRVVHSTSMTRPVRRGCVGGYDGGAPAFGERQRATGGPAWLVFAALPCLRALRPRRRGRRPRWRRPTCSSMPGGTPDDGRFWHALPTPFTVLTSVLGYGEHRQPVASPCYRVSPACCWSRALIPLTGRPSTTACSAATRPSRPALRVRPRSRHSRPLAPSARRVPLEWQVRSSRGGSRAVATRSGIPGDRPLPYNPPRPHRRARNRDG